MNIEYEISTYTTYEKATLPNGPNPKKVQEHTGLFKPFSNRIRMQIAEFSAYR